MKEEYKTEILRTLGEVLLLLRVIDDWRVKKARVLLSVLGEKVQRLPTDQTHHESETDHETPQHD